MSAWMQRRLHPTTSCRSHPAHRGHPENAPDKVRYSGDFGLGIAGLVPDRNRSWFSSSYHNFKDSCCLVRNFCVFVTDFVWADQRDTSRAGRLAIKASRTGRARARSRPQRSARPGIGPAQPLGLRAPCVALGLNRLDPGMQMTGIDRRLHQHVLGSGQLARNSAFIHMARASRRAATSSPIHAPRLPHPSGRIYLGRSPATTVSGKRSGPAGSGPRRAADPRQARSALDHPLVELAIDDLHRAVDLGIRRAELMRDQLTRRSTRSMNGVPFATARAAEEA